MLENEWITLQTTNNSATRIPHLDGVNQLPAMLAQAKEGPRNSVHIHRDYDRDGHAYRRGPWKVRSFFLLFHFLLYRWLSVIIVCLSSTHMCTTRQNLGRWKSFCDQRQICSISFFLQIGFSGGLLRMEDWGQKCFSCCRFPIVPSRWAKLFSSRWAKLFFFRRARLFLSLGKILFLLLGKTLFLSSGKTLFLRAGGDWHRGGNRTLYLSPICSLDFLWLVQRRRAWQGQSSCQRPSCLQGLLSATFKLQTFLMMFLLEGHSQLCISERAGALPWKAGCRPGVSACLPLQLGSGLHFCNLTSLRCKTCWREFLFNVSLLKISTSVPVLQTGTDLHSIIVFRTQLSRRTWPTSIQSWWKSCLPRPSSSWRTPQCRLDVQLWKGGVATLANICTGSWRHGWCRRSDGSGPEDLGRLVVCSSHTWVRPSKGKRLSSDDVKAH